MITAFLFTLSGGLFQSGELNSVFLNHFSSMPIAHGAPKESKGSSLLGPNIERAEDLPKILKLSVPKKDRVKVILKSKVKNKIVKIEPKSPKEDFTLSRGNGNRLIIQYTPTDKNAYWDTKGSIVGQLTAPHPLEITPSLILTSNWPKGKKQMNLSFNGAKKGEIYSILGEITFKKCTVKTKKCKFSTAKLRYELTI